MAVRVPCLIGASWLGCALAFPAAAQSASPTGDYVCTYGCRLTDANPRIEVKSHGVDCVNEFGGLYQGYLLSPGVVACFRKIGKLSADSLTITWSDGVIWTRHGPGPK